MLELNTKCWHVKTESKVNVLALLTLAINVKPWPCAIGLIELKPKPTLKDCVPVTPSKVACTTPSFSLIISIAYSTVLSVGIIWASKLNPSGCPPVLLSLKT